MHFGEYEITLLQEETANFSEKIYCVLEICDKLLGEGLYTEERIRWICRQKHHYFYVMMKDADVIGIFYCYGDQLGRTSFYGKVEADALKADTRIGVGQSIAIEEKDRHKGLSEWMLNYCTGMLFEEESVDAILIPAWMKNGKAPANRHLERCGYELLQILRKPWASCETLKCHVCRTIPCSCDGAVYIRKRG